MMGIELVTHANEQRVDSRVIAGELEVKHKNTMEIVERYTDKFLRFGLLPFETEKPLKGSVGGRPERFALLNEDQAYFLLSLSRNTERVVELKANLVMAFRDARNQAAIDSALNMVLLPEPSTWEKRFGDDYYRALAKVTGTRYDGHRNGTPHVYGRITNKWVYAVLLPREIHKELKARRGESEKMHQWLTDGGKERLDQHIALVTLMAETSCDLKDFEARCMSRFGVPGQLSLVYPAAA